jgi:magnesium-transporting ATPase (P-type)
MMQFNVSVQELCTLMNHRGTDAPAQVCACARDASATHEQIAATYGSIDALCARLHTDAQHGVHGTTAPALERRRQVYGRNEIPTTKAKNFFQLAWQAVQDATLIVLIICAILSLGLAFYQPPDEGRCSFLRAAQLSEAQCTALIQ